MKDEELKKELAGIWWCSYIALILGLISLIIIIGISIRVYKNG